MVSYRALGFPRLIFGRQYGHHRLFDLRIILQYYNKSFHKRTAKYELMSIMVSLEREVPLRHRYAIFDWIGGLGGARKTENGFRRAIKRTRRRDWQPSASAISGGFFQPLPSLNQPETQTSGPNFGLATPPRPQRPEIRNGTECSVCTEILPPTEFPTQKISTICKHDPSICLACLAQSVDSQIDDRSWDQITCPECPERLSYEAVKLVASGEGFQGYAQKSFISAIEQFPDFTYCLGPNCSSGQIHSGGDENPIMTCTTCHFKTCFTHKMPWHTDLTCDEYEEEQRERRMQEEASERLVDETSKACPNPKCGIHIEKTTGCDHMTCPKCKHEFCWLCMVPYEQIRTQGNAAHADTCKWHSN